jgi:hypothetical protein
VTVKLYEHEPPEVYANLRWVQDQSGYKNGWVAHCYHELFGRWPRFQEVIEPVRPADETLQRWLDLRPKRKGRRRS